jgi:Cof subfamily protein (haloacid dehalogenase superfamily)
MTTNKRAMICLDLDGTLYGADHAVSPANAEALRRAHQAGYTIALCTGRSLNCHLPSARELGITGDDLFIVGCNGAVVVRMKEDGSVAETIFETQISPANIDRIANTLGRERAQKADIIGRQYCSFSPDDSAQRMLVESHSALERTQPEWLDDYAVSLKALERAPNKMTVFGENTKALAEEAAALGLEDGIALVPGGPAWVDTVDLGHDKAEGVKLLCERLGLRIESCIAFGDGANDVSMLSTVGLGIAMAQGRQEAKEAANRVSQWTNGEDAVAKEIDDLLAQD